MSLRILQATPREGAGWVGRAFAIFLRKPIAFSALFALFMFAAVALLALPYVGAVLLLIAWPLLSLAFMIATLSAQGGGPVHPGQLVLPLRAASPDALARRRTLLTLCGLFALTNALVMLAGDAIDNGAFERLQVLLASGRDEGAQTEIGALLADPGLRMGIALRMGGTTLLSLIFWHAPALVWWHGQGVAQALFSSTLACWRNRGAFTVYGLAWAGTVILFGLVAGALFALIGAPQLALLAAVPAGLMFSTVFYVSLLFTYQGCFGSDAPVGTLAA
jgi:hypothetical protein